MLYNEKLQYLYQFRRCVNDLGDIALKLEEVKANSVSLSVCAVEFAGGTNVDKIPCSVERRIKAMDRYNKQWDKTCKAKVAVIKAINTAPSKYQAVMIRRFIRGDKWDALGVPETTAKRWVRAGVNSIVIVHQAKA